MLDVLHARPTAFSVAAAADGASTTIVPAAAAAAGECHAAVADLRAFLTANAGDAATAADAASLAAHPADVVRCKSSHRQGGVTPPGAAQSPLRKF